MNRRTLFTFQATAHAGLASVTYFDQLSPDTAVRIWAVWLAATLVAIVLDWLHKRDRDKRFASSPGAVRRDLLELYRMDEE